MRLRRWVWRGVCRVSLGVLGVVRCGVHVSLLDRQLALSVLVQECMQVAYLNVGFHAGSHSSECECGGGTQAGGQARTATLESLVALLMTPDLTDELQLLNPLLSPQDALEVSDARKRLRACSPQDTHPSARACMCVCVQAWPGPGF
jgi:hypothetical protein